MAQIQSRPQTVKFASWPHFEPEEIKAVCQILESGLVNYWTGPVGRDFEEKFSAYIGTECALSISNGTVALEIALEALGIGEGDEVIVTPRSFMATAGCIVKSGATPVFVDVNVRSGNISRETIEPAITQRTKAILLVHLAGWPCDMDPILELASARGIKVIEDCAQAHGAKYKGRSVGSMGDIGSWSFCQDKIISTGGEGGMLTMNSKSLWSKAWSIRDNGKSYDQVHKADHNPGYRWVYESFGTNARMTEIQSSLGISGLARLHKTVSARNANANILFERLSRVPILRVERPPSEIQHAYYKFYAYLRPGMTRHTWDRDRMITEIQARGVPCMSGSCSELYLESAFVKAELGPAHRLANAKELGETSLMFLVHPTLSIEAMEWTGQIVQEVAELAAA